MHGTDHGVVSAAEQRPRHGGVRDRLCRARPPQVRQAHTDCLRRGRRRRAPDAFSPHAHTAAAPDRDALPTAPCSRHALPSARATQRRFTRVACIPHRAEGGRERERGPRKVARDGGRWERVEGRPPTPIRPSLSKQQGRVQETYRPPFPILNPERPTPVPRSSAGSLLSPLRVRHTCPPFRPSLALHSVQYPDSDFRAPLLPHPQGVGSEGFPDWFANQHDSATGYTAVL